MSRLVSVGNVVIDLVAAVPALPERGGDVLSTGSSFAAGGSFNVLIAAVRQGLPAAYAGGHGTGVFGDLARSALTDAGIPTLIAANAERDSGFDIALVDAGGERTFVTSFDAEAQLSEADVAGIALQADDLIHVSGYGLLTTTNAEVLGPWITGLAGEHVVLVDPGPLVADIPASTWGAVSARADWISCNAREAAILTGEANPFAAARILNQTTDGVIVRLGPDGCVFGTRGEVRHIPGFVVTAVDTNGAGDAHVGAFLAALAAGLDPADGATRANACAALAVTRPGPATAPTVAELRAFLR
jgi:sugar/nucleoside kinase (ribokinase family)